jgi:hypothetical protein
MEDEEGSEWRYDYPGPEYSDSQQSDASSSHSIVPSESASRPPRRRRPPSPPSQPASNLTSDNFTYGHPPAMPSHQAPPHGAWPYRPHGPASHPQPSYYPAAPLPPYAHAGYGPQPPLGSAHTIYGPSSDSVNPPLPAAFQGAYPGFYAYPVLPPAPQPAAPPTPQVAPRPAPAGQDETDSLAPRRDELVVTLEEKVQGLKKELEDRDAENRARVEELLVKQEAKEAARLKKEAELAAIHAKEKEEAEWAERRAREEADLRAREEAENKPVRFKDAIGRKLAFPYRQCKRWVVCCLLISPVGRLTCHRIWKLLLNKPSPTLRTASS